MDVAALILELQKLDQSLEVVIETPPVGVAYCEDRTKHKIEYVIGTENYDKTNKVVIVTEDHND